MVVPYAFRLRWFAAAILCEPLCLCGQSSSLGLANTNLYWVTRSWVKLLDDEGLTLRN